MKCPVCKEGTEGNRYCQSHTHALENLKSAFHNWIIGYGDTSATEFLNRLEKLPGTGQKTREIARFLLENPREWKS